jgi:hypothetical protein
MELIWGVGLVVGLIERVTEAVVPPPGWEVTTVMAASPGDWTSAARIVDVRVFVFTKKVALGDPLNSTVEPAPELLGTNCFPVSVRVKDGEPA